jgi:plastocyanin
MLKTFAKWIVTVAFIYTIISFLIVSVPKVALAAQIHDVEIQKGSTIFGDKSYSPNPIGIMKGDTIRFVNKDTVVHTATSGDGSTPSGVFDSGYLGPNKAAEVTINEIGDIPFYCQAHPTMVGLVRVSDESTTGNQNRVVTTFDGATYVVTSSSTSSAKVTQVTINPGESLVVAFDGVGVLELTLPESMIGGINSVTTNDGTALPFTQTNVTDSSTTIKLTISDGPVVIRGARVVPELSSIAALMIAISMIGFIVAVARFSRGDIGSSKCA